MGLEMRITDGTNVLVDLSNLVDANSGGYRQVPGTEESEWAIERLPITLLSSTVDATVQALGRAFTQAKRYEKERKGTPIYLEGRKKATDAWKRSRLKGDGLSDYDIDRAIRSDHTFGTIAIERQNWWEAVTLVTAPLTNPNGTNVAGSIRIGNRNDGSGTSPNVMADYVAIAGANIQGDLPAPCIVTLAATCLHAYFGIGAHYTLTWDLVLEGEDSPTLVDGSAADCSGGAYGSGSHAVWSLIGSNVQGAYFWPVLRGRFPVGLQVDLLASTGAQARSYFPTIGSASQWGLLPMEPIQLPPYPSDANDASPVVNFYLNGAAQSADVDFLALLPADYWMEFDAAPAGGVYPTSVVVDCAELEAKTVGMVTPATAAGTGIFLQPGLDQRLYCLWSIDWQSDSTATGTIRLQYRPRWRML